MPKRGVECYSLHPGSSFRISSARLAMMAGVATPMWIRGRALVDDMVSHDQPSRHDGDESADAPETGLGVALAGVGASFVVGVIGEQDFDRATPRPRPRR